MGTPKTEVVVPADLECRMLCADDTELALLSFKASSKPKLTPAECEVALAIVRGLSNTEIAKERGAALRTVANQVGSLLKKLGVSSRVELASKLTIADLV